MALRQEHKEQEQAFFFLGRPAGRPAGGHRTSFQTQLSDLIYGRSLEISLR